MRDHANAAAEDDRSTLRRADEHFAHGEFAASVELLTAYLAGGEGSAASRHGAFERLAEALCHLQRHEELAEAFQAPWSPLRGTCDAEFDRRYMASVAAAGQTPLPLARRLRFHSLLGQLQATHGVAGRVAECGCFRGLSTHLLCLGLLRESSAFDGEGFHAIDSFRGLSDPTEEDAVPASHPRSDVLRQACRAGTFAAPVEKVRKALARFPRAQIHEGWIPEVFGLLPRQAYRFVHVDVDLYAPTIDCLEYFYPLLSPGGRIVSDDFGWPGARRAIEEFAGRHGVEYSVSPFDQAVLVRR